MRIIRSFGAALGAALILAAVAQSQTAAKPEAVRMVLIPAGSFIMGDAHGEGWNDERPAHAVDVSAFHMDRHEVTKALWDRVRMWALDNGYQFDNPGQGKAPDHPVHSISWHDAVKWCNARSEKEGRVPAYYTDATHTTVYRMGQINVRNDWVKWNTGYRLPTEAEWEKAARGGAVGRRFPWRDTDEIRHSRANYHSSGDASYDTSLTRGYHPAFGTGREPYTSPVGSFAANGYGLHDMAGNVSEWCWDYYASLYYTSSPARDPRGPETGVYRVVRGGGWDSDAFFCRAAIRVYYWPDAWHHDLGFRCVRPADERADMDR